VGGSSGGGGCSSSAGAAGAVGGGGASASACSSFGYLPGFEEGLGERARALSAELSRSLRHVPWERAPLTVTSSRRPVAHLLPPGRKPPPPPGGSGYGGSGCGSGSGSGSAGPASSAGCSVTVAANQSSVAAVFDASLQRARRMLEAGAYVHWYERYGCERAHFAEAFEVAAQVVDEYRGAARDAADPGAAGDY
jgi:hypothetical protein